MQVSNWFKIFMLGMMVFSLTAVGCGDDGETTDDAAEGTEAAADAGSDDAAGDMKSAMLDMTKEMYDIVDGIESVDDVKAADDEIGKIFDNLVENMRGMFKDPSAMTQMQTMMEEDSELKEWGEKMEAAIAKLEADHPEAAAELDGVMQKHSMKMMTLMSEAMQSMSPEDMEAMTGEGEEAPAEMEDAAAGE